MERFIQRQQETKEETASSARSDLDEAHRQSIPAGVEMFRMDTQESDDLPPLVDIPPEQEYNNRVRHQAGTLKDIVVSGSKSRCRNISKSRSKQH